MLAQIEDDMDNVDYYMKCLDAKAMLETLNIIMDSLWENDDQKNTESVIQQVEQIHQYIQKNYFESITLTSLAGVYHMDASYLSRVFSQKYGETVIAFLTRVRMEHAVELMKDQDKNWRRFPFWSDMTIITISAGYSAKRWESAPVSTVVSSCRSEPLADGRL